MPGMKSDLKAHHRPENGENKPNLFHIDKPEFLQNEKIPKNEQKVV